MVAVGRPAFYPPPSHLNPGAPGTIHHQVGIGGYHFQSKFGSQFLSNQKHQLPDKPTDVDIQKTKQTIETDKEKEKKGDKEAVNDKANWTKQITNVELEF